MKTISRAAILFLLAMSVAWAEEAKDKFDAPVEVDIAGSDVRHAIKKLKLPPSDTKVESEAEDAKEEPIVFLYEGREQPFEKVQLTPDRGSIFGATATRLNTHQVKLEGDFEGKTLRGVVEEIDRQEAFVARVLPGKGAVQIMDAALEQDPRWALNLPLHPEYAKEPLTYSEAITLLRGSYGLILPPGANLMTPSEELVWEGTAKECLVRDLVIEVSKVTLRMQKDRGNLNFTSGHQACPAESNPDPNSTTLYHWTLLGI
ncbi:MAG: hypothetical protein PWP23_1993 [Candidatus Sumerlaeota bacterium]|nr:hypothetical protein [Candidatus Sumerlaeota bacterium]